MTSSALPAPHMQRLLEDIAKRKGFRGPRYTVSKGSQAGDNYLGVLYRVEVAEEGEAEPGLRLIFKGMPANSKRREEMGVAIFFNNELNVYRTVLPSLTRFLADKGMDEVRQADVFPFAPRCYEATSGGEEGEDTLVLEDMRPLGFTMHDRKVGLDEHHIRAVFRSLAYLHATSLAMEAQRPQEFAKLRGAVTETLFNPDNPLTKHFDGFLMRTYGFVEERFPEGSAGCIKLNAFIQTYFAKMQELVAPSEAGPNVIGHGDCWTNNLLFKYCAKSGAVQEACLLDFQLTRYAPPVVDLLYLVYSCTVREWREVHLDKMLREYHDGLSAALRRLGCDPEHVYSWESMQAQLRERGLFGLGMAIMTIPTFLADSDEIADLDRQFESGASVRQVFSHESKSGLERNKRLCDTIEETIARGWL